MLLQVILEGIGLGVLLILVCAIGIRKGAVGMVHLYSPAVQQRCVKLGLTTHEKIKRNSLLLKAVCIPGYIGYVLVCVYGINGAHGFAAGFWQLLVILSVMNLIDRFLIDGYWVEHTNAYTTVYGWFFMRNADTSWQKCVNAAAIFVHFAIFDFLINKIRLICIFIV